MADASEFEGLNSNYYLLLTSADPAKWQTGEAQMSTSRYLERSTEAVKKRFGTLDELGRYELMHMPALFTYELSERDQQFMRVGRITRLQERSESYALTFEFDPRIAPIDQRVLLEWKDDLDINERAGEHTRTHWSIKEVDLYAVLRKRHLFPGPEVFTPLARAMEGHSIVMPWKTAPSVTPAPRTLPWGLEAHQAPLAAAAAQVMGKVDTSTVGGDKVGTASSIAGAAPAPRAKAFIVHGRDDALKNEVALFLMRIGIEPIVLHEQANGGRTIITKFREEAADVAFAVVLMTPDDVGGLAQSPDGTAQSLQSRARQNVIFELGFFVGQLGPARVCALVKDRLETPSDFDGVVYVPYDAPGAWKQLLVRELDHAGVPHDPTALFRAS
jgi:predicted nucleotide-binding protein